MKKAFLVAALLFGGFAAAQAQEIAPKGSSFLNIGVGLGSSIAHATLPISASYDYTVASNLINGDNGAITIGGLAGYAHGSDSYVTPDYKAEWSYNHFILGARGAFHYQFVDKLDTYAGLLLGYNIAKVSSKSGSTTVSAPAASAFQWSTYIGARYFFTNNIGAFAELGYGVSYLTLGATFKL